MKKQFISSTKAIEISFASDQVFPLSDAHAALGC
jgi:hypothetical protein